MKFSTKMNQKIIRATGWFYRIGHSALKNVMEEFNSNKEYVLLLITSSAKVRILCNVHATKLSAQILKT